MGLNAQNYQPSLLSADFAKLDREIKSAEDAGADLLHVDVMDGHFVPNITIGPLIVEAISRSATLPLDVHLMISEPEKYAKQFIDAGSNSLNFHVETVADPQKLIQFLRSRGVKAGIALNPETPVDIAAGYAAKIDQFLVMTVHPGFGGQQLIPECVEKIRRLAKIAPDSVDIEVDGGSPLRQERQSRSGVGSKATSRKRSESLITTAPVRQVRPVRHVRQIIRSSEEYCAFAQANDRGIAYGLESDSQKKARHARRAVDTLRRLHADGI